QNPCSSEFIPVFVLLCSMVADISARALTATSVEDQPTLSARHYQHTDPSSGTKLACDKCPAGTYVSTHCSPSSVRECTPCPEGTFTRGENGVQQCHQPCTTTQDRVCACPPNSFSPRGAVGGCKPHSLCPPGTRVKKRGTQTEDVLCRPCTKGTFSSVESRATKCRNHTDCRALGLVLLSTGTRETDNVCGPPSTTPSLFPPSSSFGPEHAAIKQEPISSTLTSILYGVLFNYKGKNEIWRKISGDLLRKVVANASLGKYLALKIDTVYHFCIVLH
uniref:TNFR-Cys domain-containing protein n=1 Tax=Oryzias sinensis TaxID=183150 RepID=A0A8C7X547_9TELE